MTPLERRHLAASLDLSRQFVGAGLQSLIRAANVDLIGSWASVKTDLVSPFRFKCLIVYDELAEAREAMPDEDKNTATPIIPAVESLEAGSTNAQVFRAEII